MEDTCNNCEPGHFFLELWWRPTTRGRVDLLVWWIRGDISSKTHLENGGEGRVAAGLYGFLYAGANGESLHSFINWGNKFCPRYYVLNSGCDVAFYRIIIKLIEPGLWISYRYLFGNYSCHSNRIRCAEHYAMNILEVEEQTHQGLRWLVLCFTVWKSWT